MIFHRFYKKLLWVPKERYTFWKLGLVGSKMIAATFLKPLLIAICYTLFKDQSAQHQDKLHKLWSALSNFVKLDKLFEAGSASWILLSLMKLNKLHEPCEARCNSEWTLGVLALNLIIALRIIIVEPGGPRTVLLAWAPCTFPQLL